MVNKFIGIGRITKNAELKYTKNTKAVSNFSIAINKHGKDDPTFLDINLWGKSAEAVNQYLTKGTQVYVDGELEIQKWEKDNIKHQRTVINCFTVQLLGSKSDSGVDIQDRKQIKQDSGIDLSSIPF